MDINQWMGWGLTALAALGFTAIGLVAIWPGWRRWRVLRQASREGFKRLSMESGEARQLQGPEAAGLLGLGTGCRLRAAWRMPVPDVHIAAVRCSYDVPRPGGTTRKTRSHLRFLALRPLSVEGAFTVQPPPPDNPLARLAVGMIERSTAAQSVTDELLLPEFRARFTVRGAAGYPGAPVKPGEAFQRACTGPVMAGDTTIDLGRLLAGGGALAVSPHGLMLDPGQDYSPGGVQELRAIGTLMTRLLRTL